MGKFYAWKFLIPPGELSSLPDEPDVAFGGIVAVAVAADAETARAVLRENARLTGKDARWLDCPCKTVKQPIRMPLDGPGTLVWAEV